MTKKHRDLPPHRGPGREGFIQQTVPLTKEEIDMLYALADKHMRTAAQQARFMLGVALRQEMEKG